MGTKIGGEGQFDKLKKMECEPNPKIPPRLFLDSGAMSLQVLKSVIPNSFVTNRGTNFKL